MSYINLPTPTERIKFIKEKLAKVDRQYDLVEDYCEWDQWLKWDVWQTRSWQKVPHVETEATQWNAKIKATNNRIWPAVDDMVGYAIWIASNKSIFSSNESFNTLLKSTKNDNLVKEFMKDYLIYNLAVGKIYIDKDDNKEKISHICPESVIIERDPLDSSKILSVSVHQEIDPNTATSLGYDANSFQNFFNSVMGKDDDAIIYSEIWTKESMMIMINWQILDVKLNPYSKIPFAIAWEEDKVEESFVFKLIWAQDIININLSVELNSNIANLNPLTIIKLPESEKDDFRKKWDNEKKRKINIGSGWAIVIYGEGDVKRVVSQSVTQEYLACVDRYIQNFYDEAKLTNAKPENVNALSGQALKIIMNKTIKFIQELRMQFTWFYEEFAEMKWMEDLEFYWSDTVFDDKSGLIEEASKLSNAGFSKKFIMKHMGYSDAEIADELAIDLQNAEMMKRANILIGEGK